MGAARWGKAGASCTRPGKVKAAPPSTRHHNRNFMGAMAPGWRRHLCLGPSGYHPPPSLWEGQGDGGKKRPRDKCATRPRGTFGKKNILMPVPQRRLGEQPAAEQRAPTLNSTSTLCEAHRKQSTPHVAALSARTTNLPGGRVIRHMHLASHEALALISSSLVASHQPVQPSPRQPSHWYGS